MRVFPDAKVVLTTRDPEKWYNSVKETIFRTREFLSGPIGIFLKMVGMFNIFNTMDNLTNAINKRSISKKIQIKDITPCILAISLLYGIELCCFVSFLLPRFV